MTDRREPPSRWLMTPFIVLAGWIGCAYIFGDPVRTSTPSFGVARDITPLATWGYLFLLGAVTLTVTTLLNNERWMAIALFIGGVIYTWWGALFLVTAIGDPTASLNGFVLYFFIAFVHFASAWRTQLRATL